jgi:hypothetical protein
MVFLSATNVLGYLVTNKLNAVVFFALVSLLSYQFSKNMAVILLISIIIAMFSENYLDVVIAGLISVIASLIIYFISLNGAFLYENSQVILKDTESQDLKNSSELEKIKLEDENVNAKNLSISKFKGDHNTDDLSRMFFLNMGNKKSKVVSKSNDLNSEKYNISPVKDVIIGAKVMTDVLKKDIKNEIRVSDLNF